MTKKHGFIIPDEDSLTDLEGLLDYLSQKVSFVSTVLLDFCWLYLHWL